MKQTYHVYVTRGRARWYLTVMAYDKADAQRKVEAEGYTVDKVRNAPAPPRMGRR